MKKLLWIAALFISGVMGISGISNAAHMPDSMSSKSEVELRMNMRKLWEDHITYTRNYIISELAGLEDVDAVTERLLRNQTDLGDAIKPYYGAEAGTKLTSLLKDHIVVATEVVKAAKAGDNEALNQANKKWADNAEELAAFLSNANPHWPKKILAEAFTMHLSFTTDEVVSRLKKKWTADIAAYDKGHEHMLMVADVLTNGIVKQFPDKFQK